MWSVMQKPRVDPDQALRRLVAEGVITAEQAAAVHEAQSERAPAAGRWWAEVAGYLGGVLVLGAGALLLATTWDRLTGGARAGLLVAITLALLGAGVALAGGPARLSALGRAPARRRVVAVLFALASGTAAGAAGVFAEEVFASDNASVSAFAVGLVVAVAGYATVRTAPGLLAAAAMSLMLGGAVMGEWVRADSPVPIAVTYLALGSMWATLALAAVAVPRQLGLGIGAAITLLGAQLLLGEPAGPPWAYGVTAAVAVMCFVLYRLWRDTVLVVAGVVAAAIAAPEAVWDWTDGAAGGALVLLVAGLALIAASGLGLGLWRGHGSAHPRPSSDQPQP